MEFTFFKEEHKQLANEKQNYLKPTLLLAAQLLTGDEGEIYAAAIF